MTSDKFSRVRVDEITFRDRQRKDVGDLSGLAGSIEELELLQPVVITRWKENGLHRGVVGERRFRSHQKLGLEYIDVRFTDEVDPIKLMKMEFAENEQREDIPFIDRMNALVKIHEAEVARDPKWTQVKTANDCKVEQPLVSDYLAITELVRDQPKRCLAPATT
jgi:ParB/RepB/Spo0J family partition protein